MNLHPPTPRSFRRMHATAAVAACLGLLPGLGFAQTAPTTRQRLALLPFSGTNVHPGYLEAGREILKDHLIATGRYEVILLPGAPGATELPAPEAVALGRQAGTAMVAVAHFARLSGTGRVRLVTYRVDSGALVHADSIGVAGGPDDLDPALQRLAVAMAEGKSVSQSADIETVTQREADPYRKQTATKSFGVRLSALVPFNRPGEHDATGVPGFGIFWLYDARSLLAEIGFDINNDSNSASSFTMGIGGYYPLSRANFAPYVGLLASYAFVDFGGTGSNGLSIQPTLGALFGRLSTVQFRGDLGYFINTFAEAPDSVAGNRRRAHGPRFSLGIGF